MADDPKTDAKANPSAQNGAAPAKADVGENAPVTAPLGVIHQYLKDFSFENPIGAEYLALMKEAPTGTVRVDVRVKPMTPPDIEVSVFLGVDAKAGERTVYKAECDYAGVFRIGKMPPEHVLPVIMIEAPRLLFPFARQVIAQAVGAGGFPPLLIHPVDFVALFREKRAELMESMQRQQQEGAAAKA